MEELLDRKLDRETIFHYIFQSFLAALVLFIGLNLPLISAPILIAAIGSTAFIVFAMPENRTSRPRNVLGGHVVCGLIGIGVYSLNADLLPITALISIGVFLSIIVMVSFDIEHPPAGGTVIFLILNPDLKPFMALLMLSGLMVVVSYLLSSYMKDLV